VFVACLSASRLVACTAANRARASGSEPRSATVDAIKCRLDTFAAYHVQKVCNSERVTSLSMSAPAAASSSMSATNVLVRERDGNPVEASAQAVGLVFTWGRGDHCLGVAPQHSDSSGICPFAQQVQMNVAKATSGLDKLRAASDRVGSGTRTPLRAVQVACGESMTAAIGIQGELYTWGTSGAGGRLGHGDTHNHSSPTRVRGPLLAHRVIHISVGEAHAGCIVASGIGFAWGKGNRGALGDGNVSQHNQLTPQIIYTQPSRTSTTTSSAAPSGIGVAPSPLCPLRFIDCSYQNTAVITRDTNELYVFGSNEYGKLGLGSNVQTQPWPKRLQITTVAAAPAISTSSADDLANITTFSVVSLGSSFSGFVTTSGSLYMCGYGRAGNLGLGTRVSHTTPQLVEALVTAGEKVVHVSCTRGQITVVSGSALADVEGREQPHALVCTASGRCYSMGTAHKGMCGNMAFKTLSPKNCDELVPYAIGGSARDHRKQERTEYLRGMRVRAAVASHIHSAVLGTWVSEDVPAATAAAADVSASEEHLPSPSELPAPAAVAAASKASAAVTSSSFSSSSSPTSDRTCEVLTFGCGSDGRMGVRQYMEGLHGARSRLKCYVSIPSPVVGLEGKRVLQVDSSRRHMVALVEE
jgi:alpha-tubulin suppressor-like RCC1 family protein